ncbi:DUF4435 domain-containing protein [Yinghuangia aomiensis]|uniref:DUF4435 domain-containing protein n=1 Tax=Yinghuangia aomiensis TaxID=676205 RepID=A0ABP9HZQ3_9ACTN
MSYEIQLPGGTNLPGREPVVVIGPNGSGKTRQSRNINASMPIDYINALRNTRVAPEVPAMGFNTALNNFNSQRSQARASHWELTLEFDYMLSTMLAEDAMANKRFAERYWDDPENKEPPEVTPPRRVEEVWGKIFPGRRLRWKDWNPTVENMASGVSVEYSGNQMSDGEKAALFVAARVFSAEPGILVVDEPETHFHSLLAVRLWDALEDARTDVRFVYVTHDLTFAVSRREARFVIASPAAGLRVLELDGQIPEDLGAALLGAASLSFYASRIVFCEGEESSWDAQLYKSWFNGADTVVKPVGSSKNVLRCVDALRDSGIAHSLESVGIIDRDYHPDAFIDALDVHVLPVHEIESIFAHPQVVQAVANHLSLPFDTGSYLESLRATVTDQQKAALVIERWKARMEPNIVKVISGAAKRGKSVEALNKEIPTLFDVGNWDFSPQGFLAEEKARVESAFAGEGFETFLALVPGKQLVPQAARTVGMEVRAYCELVARALRDSKSSFSGEIAVALSALLPPRAVPISMPPIADTGLGLV